MPDTSRTPHVVRDNNRRHFQSLGDAHDELINAVGNDGIKPRRRLVVKHNARLINDGARESNALPHATG